MNQILGSELGHAILRSNVRFKNVSDCICSYSSRLFVITITDMDFPIFSPDSLKFLLVTWAIGFGIVSGSSWYSVSGIRLIEFRNFDLFFVLVGHVCVSKSNN